MIQKETVLGEEKKIEDGNECGNRGEKRCQQTKTCKYNVQYSLRCRYQVIALILKIKESNDLDLMISDDCWESLCVFYFGLIYRLIHRYPNSRFKFLFLNY